MELVEKLEPCPFPHKVVRGPFVEIDSVDFFFIRVSCADCGCAGPYVPFDGLTVKKAQREKAITAWNTRPAMPTNELIEAAYREAWHEGYATGDVGGRYHAVENDGLASDARAALSKHLGRDRPLTDTSTSP